MIPDNPDARLTRNATAAALSESGFPTAPATLSTKASRGGGPPFQKFGSRPLYRRGDALQWAQARLSKPVASTSELDGAGLASSATTDREARKIEKQAGSPRAAAARRATRFF